jgi:tetratricopeptide (TPR) repeat protein
MVRFPEDRRSEQGLKHQTASPHGSSQHNPPSQTLIEATLKLARKASQSGQRQRAFELSQQVAEIAPDNAEAWLYLAVFTDNEEQRLVYLNKALNLAPEHAEAQYGMYETLKSYLQQDPYLRYLEETDTLYQVLTREGQAIVVPKDRAVDTPYPPVKPTPLHPVFRWLRYSLIGLLTAGLVTLVCAPIAALQAWRAIRHPLDIDDHRRATMALVYAGVLWVIGLALSILFLLHL